MDEAKTVEFQGKCYALTRSGWVDTRSYLRVDVQLSRTLDRIAAACAGSESLYDVDSLLDQAKNARAERQLGQAERLVRQALRADQRHPGAQAILCGILRERGLPEQALRETAAMRSSLYPPLLTSRAAAYADLGQWAQALEELQPVLAAGGNPHATVILQRIQAEQPALFRRDQRPPRPLIAPPPPPAQAPAPEQADDPALKHVTIMTAGGCGVDPGPGGYAALLRWGDAQREVCGGYRLTTSARMELMAVIMALRCLKYPCSVTVHSPSHDLVDSMNRGWARSWQANGWMRMRRTRVRDADLWQALLNLSDQHDLAFVWIDRPDAVVDYGRCWYLAQHAAAEHATAIDQPFEAQHADEAASRKHIIEPGPQRTRAASWTIIQRQEHPIHAVLDGAAGTESGQYVYIIRYCTLPAYVGLTRSSPALRLHGHITDQSNVGVAISADRPQRYLGWSVHILQIDGDLEAAERHYIRALRPPLNKRENSLNQAAVEKTVRIFRAGYRRSAVVTQRRKIKRP